MLALNGLGTEWVLVCNLCDSNTIISEELTNLPWNLDEGR